MEVSTTTDHGVSNADFCSGIVPFCARKWYYTLKRSKCKLFNEDLYDEGLPNAGTVTGVEAGLVVDGIGRKPVSHGQSGADQSYTNPQVLYEQTAISFTTFNTCGSTSRNEHRQTQYKSLHFNEAIATA